MSPAGSTPASGASLDDPVAKSGDAEADVEPSRPQDGAEPWRRVCIPWAPGAGGLTGEGPIEGLCAGGCPPVALAAWAYDSWRATALPAGVTSAVTPRLGFFNAPFSGLWEPPTCQDKQDHISEDFTEPIKLHRACTKPHQIPFTRSPPLQ